MSEESNREVQENGIQDKGTQVNSNDTGSGAGVQPAPRSKWFGRGIYGSKDVPIKLLDGLIGVVLVAIVGLTILFAVNGGFLVSFDTQGGTAVESEKLRHGSLVEEPEAPIKAGYDFDGWFVADNPEQQWNFATDKLGGDLKLVAAWTAADITVRFDLDGGTVDGKDSVERKTVTYLETYGELPVPRKEGSQFDGWLYDGEKITADTEVKMTGEHVLTAVWVP